MSVWDAKKPKRQSMLWGRSDLAEKFYSGEKSSNPWVRDLLWKKNITDEHKKFGDDSAIDLVPPHMRSVTLANVSASINQKEKRRQKQRRAVSQTICISKDIIIRAVLISSTSFVI